MDELNERPTAPNPIFGFTAGSLDAPGDNEWPHYFVGTPDKVAARFRGLASEFNLGEFIVNRITHDHEARLRSYSLLAEAVGFETRLSESVAA